MLQTNPIVILQDPQWAKREGLIILLYLLPSNADMFGACVEKQELIFGGVT